MNVVFVFIGLIIGGAVSWIISSLVIRLKMISKDEYEHVTQKSNMLFTDLEVEKQKTISLQDEVRELNNEIVHYKGQIDILNKDIQTFERTVSTL